MPRKKQVVRKSGADDKEGFVYQRKSTQKCYFIYYTGKVNADGKRERPWIDLETTDKKDPVTKEKVKNIRADLAKKGKYTPPSKDSFGEWLDFWLDEIIKPKTIDEPTSTYDYYKSLIQVHIKPQLGEIPLKELDQETLLKFFNKLRVKKRLSQKKDTEGNFIPSDKRLSTRTIRGVQDIIVMALDKAIKMRKIPENPFDGIDRIKYQKDEVVYMTTEQVADFLEKIKYDPWYPVYITDFGTGLRRSEIAALKWENVDLENKKIKVDKAKVKLNTYAEEGPKTKLVTKGTKSKKGERKIPIPDDVVEALKKWRETQIKDIWEWESKRHKEQEEMEAGKKLKRKHPRPPYQKSGYVFTFEDGRPVTPDHLTKHFKKLLQTHGYEGFTFHKQRHSYATMLLENGVEMKTIQEQLGDATLKVVSDIYTHVAEKLKEQAVDKLSGFSKKQTN
jgi:integrase